MSASTGTQWEPITTGDDLASTLPGILRSAEITTVGLLRYVRPESLRGREISDEARALTVRARAEYRARGFGFWDFLFERLPTVGQPTRVAVLERALQHSAEPKREIIPVETFVGNLQGGDYSNLPGRQLVSLSSRVDRGPAQPEQHIPMLDFTIASNDHNLPTVLDVLEVLGVDGNLYDSGNSYQLIGATPVSANDLRVLLARAQLLSPITDHRWIAHQLLSGECSLRVSTELDGKQKPQVLVASRLPDGEG